MDRVQIIVKGELQCTLTVNEARHVAVTLCDLLLCDDGDYCSGASDAVAECKVVSSQPRPKKTAQPQRGGQKLAQRVSAGLAANNDSSPSGAAQEAACNAASGVKRSDKNK